MKKQLKNDDLTSLIDKSIQVMDSIDINEIWHAGIRRDPKNYHITVMYPPLKAMNTINENQVYSRFENQRTALKVHKANHEK